MAFHLDDGEAQSLTEINLVPLIDIMLVLMIIFLVTATVMNPAVPLNLPATGASSVPSDPAVVSVSINASGQYFWNDQPLSLAQLDEKMTQAAKLTPQPSVQLRADKSTAYDHVAQVIAGASQAGLANLAFVSDTRKN